MKATPHALRNVASYNKTEKEAVGRALAEMDRFFDHATTGLRPTPVFKLTVGFF
jgi:hypothetical protein